MAKTMKITQSCNKPQLSFHTQQKTHVSEAFETEQRKNSEHSNEAAAGFSTSALTSTMYNRLYKIKCAGSLESLANVQLALISHIETQNAPYLSASCDPIG